jgi:S-adenosylmethionine hydrolase
MRPIVTLTTDFGLRDSFIGAMKGVLLTRCPDVDIVDICHEIPPHDILAGAVRLASAAPYFPVGTVHLAVVDPGVGSGRRAVAISARGHYFVGPDNGVLTLAAPAGPGPRRSVLISRPDLWLAKPSNTFHGRDILAPVAAYVACGGSIADLGPLVDSLVELKRPLPERVGESVVGAVLDVDRFGNLVTNVRLEDFAGADVAGVQVGKVVIKGLSTFYDPAHRFVALMDSDGWLEVAAPGMSAAQLLAADLGDRVVVQLRPR